MAFQRNDNTAAASSSFAATAPQRNDNWKATAFINIWLPLADGKRKKVGQIALRDSKKFEAALIDRLNTGGEEALAAFAEHVEIDFNMANDDAEVQLGF